MDNGTSASVVRQFDELAALPGAMERNRRYYIELLRLAGRRRRALDLGCGTGELSRELALRCASVVGVDVSPRMIEEARARNWGLNIVYVEADAEEYLRDAREDFDLITSVAAFHHMDEPSMLSLCGRALAPGGLLLVLDLYESETPLDYLVTALSALASPIERLMREGRPARPSRERELWEAHRPDDHFLTLRELRGLAQDALGDFTLERRPIGHYLLAYEKPSSAAASQKGRSSA